MEYNIEKHNLNILIGKILLLLIENQFIIKQ